MTSGTFSLLPPKVDLEARAVLKALAPAHRYLAELKGLAATIPNEHILINTHTCTRPGRYPLKKIYKVTGAVLVEK